MSGEPKRTSIQSYEDLDVWQLAMELAEMTYAITTHFPKDETYGLTAQMKRACVSIPSNIAEGFGRDGTALYLYFLKVALGSTRELETQLLLSMRLKMAAPDEVQKVREAAVRVSKMLRGLIRALENRRT